MKPVAWNKVKESELVGMTLIELLLVFIFAFLLVINLFYRDLQKAKADNEDLPAIEQLVEEILATVPDSELDQDPDSPESGDNDVVERLVYLRDVLMELSEQGLLKNPEAWQVVSNNGGINALLGRLAELEQQLRDRDKLIADNNLVPPEAGYGGGDKPGNCWYEDLIRKRGDQYLLKITILESELLLEPVWPESRANDSVFSRLDELLERVPGTISYEVFMALADDAFEHSKTRACRFVVRAIDGATTKEGFQRGLKTIEERFYKYAENF